MIRIILDDERIINIELDEVNAPISVTNFLKLIDKKYFDGVIFHRVIKNFMIQTGKYYIDDNSLKEKEDVESIKGEFTENGFNNPLKHLKGTISMARTSDMNSASSQFFICSVDCPHLDGAYAAFGKVADEESMKVVEDISNVETARFYYFNDFPVEPVIIKTIERV